MMKSVVFVFICAICNGMAVVAFFYTNASTFDGYELMIIAAMAGLLLYFSAIFTIDKFLYFGLVEGMAFVSCAIILTACLHFFSVSETTFEAGSIIVSKERKWLRNGSSLYFLTVNASGYGQQEIWVEEDVFDKLSAGENLRLALSEGLLGYKVVVGYFGN